MAVNTIQLEEAMKKSELTKEQIADRTGINRSTLYRKMKNGENFTVGEMQKLVDTIPLTKSEASEIFFNRKVALSRQGKGNKPNNNQHSA